MSKTLTKGEYWTPYDEARQREAGNTCLVAFTGLLLMGVLICGGLGYEGIRGSYGSGSERSVYFGAGALQRGVTLEKVSNSGFRAMLNGVQGPQEVIPFGSANRAVIRDLEGKKLESALCRYLLQPGCTPDRISFQR